ncbi:GTPase-activating protein [Sodalis sp.]|uniref:GTPase-activating protein n=1 Tax=Sodalis sp. (in: enterobacteria) TaxID=1898979 RepID=UPI003873B1E7
MWETTEQELACLENDDCLDTLLRRLEQDEALSSVSTGDKSPPSAIRRKGTS